MTATGRARLRVLSLGAGVQSSTVLRMSLAGELPPLDHAIFADTGWEPHAVYTHLAELQDECSDAGLPLHVVRHGNIRHDLLSTDPHQHFASIPFFVKHADGTTGMGRRQCTTEYKLKPIVKKQRELIGLQPRQWAPRTPQIEVVLGISFDETHRMRDPHHPWQTHTYPLVDLRMTRQDCIDWHAIRGVPSPPRSACVGCPFHSDHEWFRMRQSDSDSWADAVSVDAHLRNGDPMRALQYLHRSCRPLAEVHLRPEDAGQLALFGTECEGLCGV